MGCWKRGYYHSHGRYVGNGALGHLAEAFDREDREQAI